jgi:hypothetical protein
VYYEIDFGIYSNPDGAIVGFSLVAEPQTEAEEFCSTLPKAFKEGRGSMDIVPDVGGKYKIIFANEGCCFGGTFEVMVTEEQGKAIQELWKDTQKLGLYKDGLFGPGFKIVLISEKDKAPDTNRNQDLERRKKCHICNIQTKMSDRR